jgi:hypothetical protein
VGFHIGVPGVVALDAQYGYFYGFASTSIAWPIATSSPGSPCPSCHAAFIVTVAAGASWHVDRASAWRFDLFAHATPFWESGSNSDAAVSLGVGVGVHYTAPYGFTVGFHVPLAGYVVATGGADFTAGLLLRYYYLTSLLSFPVATIGYRF